MRFLGLLIACTSMMLNFVARADDANCKVLHGGMRIETAADAAALKDFCEVTGPLGIFATGVKEITFPNLKSVNFISIDSEGLQSISFPKLEKVSYLLISGADLTLAEFPNLTYVGQMLSIRSRRLPFVNFPRLGTVGTMVLEGNLALQFIFADELHDIYQLRMGTNPNLNPSVTSLLSAVTRSLSPEEREYLANARAQEQQFKLQMIESRLSQQRQPTAPIQAAQIGTIGFNTYNDWYRYYYYSYWWNNLVPVGYYRYYMPYYYPY